MSEVYIPEDTEWYIAELVVVFTFVKAAENLVHINTLLIRADSPDIAYDKAIARGELENRVFRNSDEEEVQVRFRGLRGLYPVHDRLEDGAELLYEKREAVSEEDIKKILTPKEELAIFSPTWDSE
jgi:hypothetical protein